MAQYELDCLHSLFSSAQYKTGDKVTCVPCKMEAEIIKVPMPMWHIELTCNTCKAYHLNAGTAWSLAKFQKGRHEVKYPGHRVTARKVNE